MSFTYNGGPAWGYKLDASSVEEECSNEARLRQLEALLDFIANFEEVCAASTFETLQRATDLAFPEVKTEWVFGVYPDGDAVREMYSIEINWPFSQFPKTNGRINVEEFFEEIEAALGTTGSLTVEPNGDMFVAYSEE